ncbi:ComEC/Rec2 family competence protein [Mucilaginibacter achroorhodeus]|uniref:ComEC/Rec2 family competence protein n=1 Tax=Mucilaginibacter achroorhodeus TaxID=2599294 RepID=A0A563U6A9_9SPHI|nr:ComEC/Rec2 family competence protein [Mucilaginibacter achroorhodeus]TWR26890.1 ComEC/Rec2 family competence protein [Mucilaginibacter achroorhodeus]
MIASHKGQIPFLILLLPFMAGIGCAIIFPQVDINWILYSGIFISLLFAALNVFYKKLKVYRYNWIGGLLILPMLLAAGWYLTIQHNELRGQNHFSTQKASFLLVNIASEPVVKNDIVRFTADVVSTVNGKEHHPASGTLLISIKDELAKNLFYGEQLLVPSNYTAVEPPYNPGEFNYKQYLANKNIYYQAYLYPKQYRIVDAGKGNPIIAKALDIRQQLVRKLALNMRDTTAIAVASTLVLGYKADLSNEVMQAYSKTGTIHILSVSGGHVAILYGLLVYIFGFLYRPREKILRATIIIFAIWLYALLTGFSPAVCRAALMITFVIAGRTYSRHVSNLNILAVSAFVLLLYNPYWVADVGFQHEYIAV